MGVRRIAVIALSGALLAGGTGAAIAAVDKDDGKQAEQAVLDDAAKRLNVTPDKLHDALAAAQDAQLDRAVENGELTRKQADAIKAARAESGRVLGPLGAGPHKRCKVFGPGGPGPADGGPGGPAFEMRHSLLDDVAEALGTTPAKLFAQLRAGKSIADVAEANGKSLADVRAAAKAAVKSRLDKAVRDEDLTQKQADARLEHIDQKIEAIVSDKPVRFSHKLKPHARGEVRACAPKAGDEVQKFPRPDGFSS
jgi:hypothetical protein